MRPILWILVFSSIAGATDPVAKDASGPTAHMIVRAAQLDVVVDAGKAVTSPLSFTATDIVLKYLPSGRVVEAPAVSVPRSSAANDRRFFFDIARTPDTVPVAKDDQFEIEIRDLRFEGSATSVVLKVKDGVIYDSSNIKSLVQATSEALAPTKTTEEKDLFTGLNVALPAKDAAVAGDLVFNQTIASLPAQFSRQSFADSGSFGIKLKKGSTDGKDPRHFNLGFQLRKSFLFARKQELDTLRQAIAPGANPVPNQAALDALSSVRSRFWRAVLFDYGLQVEADVSDRGLGKVSNLILDLKPQLATAAMNAFGEKGYFTLRFMPAGLELGNNIANEDKVTKEEGRLVRYKAAAELKFFYEGKTREAVIQRIELNAASVYRRLFENETAYNAVTKTNVNTTRGDKLWTQVDFKLFLGSPVASIRPGLKATYQRGYLPPVFARTSVFSYGLVFESLK